MHFSIPLSLIRLTLSFSLSLSSFSHSLALKIYLCCYITDPRYWGVTKVLQYPLKALIRIWCENSFKLCAPLLLPSHLQSTPPFREQKHKHNSKGNNGTHAPIIHPHACNYGRNYFRLHQASLALQHHIMEVSHCR